MKILILPDIHCRNFWRKAIENNIGNVDKVVFLGDYLDPYAVEYIEYPETMEPRDETFLGMLQDIVSLKKNEPNKYILLTGNHTDSYIWKDFSSATRTDHLNWIDYHNFFMENLDLFNLVWVEDHVIFSHAGITKEWSERLWDILEFPENEVASVEEMAKVLMNTPLSSFNKYYIEAISDISYYRGGDSMYGSCEWADIREHIKGVDDNHNIEGYGEEGIYQVFGHTQVVKPIICDKWACLDVRKPFIIDTNTFKIEDGS